MASRLRKLLPFLYQNALKIFPDVPPRTGNGQKLHTSHTHSHRCAHALQLLMQSARASTKAPVGRASIPSSDRPMIFFNLPPAGWKCIKKNGATAAAALLIICLSGREMRWMFTLPAGKTHHAAALRCLCRKSARGVLSVFIETGHTQMRRRTFLPPPYWDIIDFLFTSNAKKSGTR